MRSNNFPDKEILDMPPDMEGVTRAKKDSKTRKYTFRSKMDCKWCWQCTYEADNLCRK